MPNTIQTKKDLIEYLLAALESIPYRDLKQLNIFKARADSLLKKLIGNTSDYRFQLNETRFAPWSSEAQEEEFQRVWDSGKEAVQELLKNIAANNELTLPILPDPLDPNKIIIDPSLEKFSSKEIESVPEEIFSNEIVDPPTNAGMSVVPKPAEMTPELSALQENEPQPPPENPTVDFESPPAAQQSVPQPPSETLASADQVTGDISEPLSAQQEEKFITPERSEFRELQDELIEQTKQNAYEQPRQTTFYDEEPLNLKGNKNFFKGFRNFSSLLLMAIQKLLTTSRKRREDLSPQQEAPTITKPESAPFEQPAPQADEKVFAPAQPLPHTNEPAPNSTDGLSSHETASTGSAGISLTEDSITPPTPPATDQAPVIDMPGVSENSSQDVVAETPSSPPIPKLVLSNRVLIVTATRSEMSVKVANFLTGLKFDPVICAIDENYNKSLLQRSEELNEFLFVVVLFSFEGYFYLKEQKVKDARLVSLPKIIFELGFVLGRLGRNKVFVVYSERKNFELPSAFFDAYYIPYDTNKIWQRELTKAVTSHGFIGKG